MFQLKILAQLLGTFFCPVLMCVKCLFSSAYEKNLVLVFKLIIICI